MAKTDNWGKITKAYDNAAKRQIASGDVEGAERTRSAAQKSLTPSNKKAFDEDTQSAKEKKMAAKKSGKKPASKKTAKTDAVSAATSKAAEAVAPTKKDDVTTEAVKRNDISASTKKEEKKPKAEMAYSADGVDVESQKRMVALGEEKAKEKTVAIANAPDSKKPNSFGSIADQRAAAAEKDKDKPAFSMPTPTAIVGETKKPNMFGSVAEQREKASAKEKDKPTVQKQNTRKPWSLEGGGPAGGGSNLGPYGPKTPMYDQDKDTSYPDSSKKQSLGSRLLSRMGSFGGRKSPTAGPATPSTPTSTATPTTSTTPTTPAPSAVANEPVMFDQSQFKGASGNIKVGGSMGTGGSSVGNKVDSSTYQNISGGGGPVTATTSGKARSNAKGGVVASTSGSATASHPRAQNAGRGSRPTNKGR